MPFLSPNQQRQSTEGIYVAVSRGIFCMLMLSCFVAIVRYIFMACRCNFDAEQFAESSIPILVVGTKIDQVANVSDELSQRLFSIAEECGADEINLVIKPSSLIFLFFVLYFNLFCTGYLILMTQA